MGEARYSKLEIARMVKIIEMVLHPWLLGETRFEGQESYLEAIRQCCNEKRTRYSKDLHNKALEIMRDPELRAELEEM